MYHSTYWYYSQLLYSLILYQQVMVPHDFFFGGGGNFPFLNTIQNFCIKVFRVFRQVCVVFFLGGGRVIHQLNWQSWYNWNIVESDHILQLVARYKQLTCNEHIIHNLVISSFMTYHRVFRNCLPFQAPGFNPGC